MAVVIKRDGSTAPVRPANVVQFSQEEIEMYASLGWVLMGTAVEMAREDRPERIEAPNA